MWDNRFFYSHSRGRFRPSRTIIMVVDHLWTGSPGSTPRSAVTHAARLQAQFAHPIAPNKPKSPLEHLWMRMVVYLLWERIDHIQCLRVIPIDEFCNRYCVALLGTVLFLLRLSINHRAVRIRRPLEIFVRKLVEARRQLGQPEQNLIQFYIAPTVFVCVVFS